MGYSGDADYSRRGGVPHSASMDGSEMRYNRRGLKNDIGIFHCEYDRRTSLRICFMEKAKGKIQIKA